VRLLETITDLNEGAGSLRRRRYGLIEVVDGRFHRVRLRPLPKLANALEMLLLGRWQHEYWPGDRIRLYYNQPWRCPNFLALTYAVSARDTSMQSACRALDVLDAIARLKRSDALLCDAANWRISARLLGRWGWEPHCPSRWHRHFIKRFYGNYPPPAAWLATAGATE
jgi:hypothetical protein